MAPEEPPEGFPEFEEGYLEALLWSEARYDEEGESEGNWDDDFTVDDFEPESLASHRIEILDFFQAQTEDLTSANLSGFSWESLGHDFCLTRNGHGAGYWDRGLGSLGDRLSEACKPYGEATIYLATEDTLGIQ